MKLFLVMFVICLRIVCAGQSLNSNDTIVFKVSEVQNVLIAAKQKNVLQQEIIKLKEDAVNLQAAISTLQKTITELEDKVGAKDKTIDTYTKQIQVMEGQLEDYNRLITNLEKQVRKERRQKRLVALAGLVLSGAVFFITK